MSQYVSTNPTTTSHIRLQFPSDLDPKQVNTPEENPGLQISQLPPPPSGTSSLSEEIIKECLKNKCIFISQGSRPMFSFLLNDFPSKIEFGGLNYRCAASAYEAQKFLGKPLLMQRFTTLNADEAYALSAEKHLEKTHGWHEKRLETMHHILRAKFGQNALLAQLLVATADAYLAFLSKHKKMDPYWMIDSEGLGKNKFGELLMSVRQEQGGFGKIPLPANYNDLTPSTTLSSPVPDSLNKTKEQILEEICELNSRINEDTNKLHTQIARDPKHKKLTRFPTCNFPYDQTLVPLSSKRFINASFVLNRQYIGTQSPKSDTYEDFWSMVLEHNVPIVVMLNRLGDPGDDIYFPFTIEDRKRYGDISLELSEEPLFKTDPTWRQSPHEEEPHAIIHRIIKIKRKDGPTRIVHHFQYQNWRDFSAGNERATAYLVQRIHSLRQECENGPITIHCHAGVGRTSALITLLDQYPLLFQKNVSVKRSVERQRSPEEGRCNSMMQSKDQYHFCYRTLLYLSSQ